MGRHPVYLLGSNLEFPPVSHAQGTGLLAVGGDLSSERVLLAYCSGIFPWPSSTAAAPILWFAPPERAILSPSAVHVSHSLRKVIRQGQYQVYFDRDCPAVIRRCAETPRRHEAGTWIRADMIDAYTKLSEQGFVHSVESYDGDELCGGLYGLSVGSCFFGESMFSTRSNASKVALVALCEKLSAWNMELLDCQLQNEHLMQFGIEIVSRSAYMKRLKHALQAPTRHGSWAEPATG